MSTKITNNLKVHGESTTQKYTDAQYNTDTQRINGAQPGTPISSKLMNTGLRNATLVTSAFIEALKTIVPNDNDLTTAITVGAATTHADLVTALIEALVKIKVETAVLADNVKSGAIVEETTRARESKQGYPLSLAVNSKLKLKTTWAGTHTNNDVIYYDVGTALRGYYVVIGLDEETTTTTAGTLTIASGETPTTHSVNLQRLTFETEFGSNIAYTKTDTIVSSSTINQIPSTKSVYDFAVAPKLNKTWTLLHSNKANGNSITLASLSGYTDLLIRVKTDETSPAVMTRTDTIIPWSLNSTDEEKVYYLKVVYDLYSGTPIEKIGKFYLETSNDAQLILPSETGFTTYVDIYGR